MKTVVLLLLFSIPRNVVSQQSPCPGIFQFQTDGRQKFGKVRIENIEEASKFFLEVEFIAKALILKNEDVGSIQYDANDLEAYDDITRKKILRYIINFPPKDNEPILTELKLNKRIICSGEDPGITNVTRVTLFHTVNTFLNVPGQGQIPVHSYSPSNPQPGSSPPAGPIPVSHITPNVQAPTTTQAPISTSTSLSVLDRIFPNIRGDPLVRELNETCGKVGPIVGPRIINGDSVNKGDWPWIVAIFLNEEKTTQFICGGTMITAKTILTAAHCINRRDDKDYDSEDIVVVAGIHNILEPDEGVSEAKPVLKVHVHSDFDSKLRSYDADIAVLIVKDRFRFSENLKPVCLWTGDDDLSQIIDLSGTVVGWGKDETGKPFTVVPKRVSEKIIPSETCRAVDDVYKQFTSYRTICAGSRTDNRGPCTGDSGSGFVMKVGGRWMIRGIVSAGFNDYSKDTCDLTQYSIYTDVAKFLVWIRRVMVI